MYMIKRGIFLVALCIMALSVAAQSVKTVTGESTFYGEASHSLEYCKLQALESAKVEALAREFGTTVSQDVYSNESSTNGTESSFFSALSTTEVKGEWIADVGEPKYEISLDNDGHYIVKCTIKGQAREITNEAVDFEALTLRNGTEKRFAETNFRSGDDLYLYVKSPVDGYVAIFLADAENNVYRLLPYSGSASSDGIKVKHGKENVFFDPKKAEKEHGIVDEMTMTANGVERNRVYVILSPRPFTHAVDTQTTDNLPPHLSYADFSKWLSGVRKRDTKMGMKTVHITITE